MPQQLWWYVARSCGILSWALVTASVLWGLVLSSKGLRRRLSPAWLLDLHRYLGGLGVIFLGLHLGGLFADSYVHFGPAELLVPLASKWRPGPVAWGIAAFYLFLAVELTSLARRRLPVKVWRATHGLSFPLYAMATGHLLTAGTDARSAPLQVAAFASVVAVVVATVARIVLTVRASSTRTKLRVEAEAMAAAHEAPTADVRFRPAATRPSNRTGRTPTPDERLAAIAAARAHAARARAHAHAGDTATDVASRAPAELL